MGREGVRRGEREGWLMSARDRSERSRANKADGTGGKVEKREGKNIEREW